MTGREGLFIMKIQNKQKSATRKKHIRKSSIVMLCSAGVLMAMAAGLLFHTAVKPAERVQIASADGTATTASVLAETMAEPEPVEQKEENPYGIDPDRPMIALTFDDGPSKHTWAIVDTLKQYNARATFFVLGSQVATHQAAIDYVLENHNEIGSHSFGHKNLTKLVSDEEVLDQIRMVDAALQEQHAYTPALFRVPYGAKDDRVQELLKAEGKPIIGWSVDPYDWKVKDKQKVVDHILNCVQDGDIVLMHDIYEPTAEAVAELVPALQQRGYQLVTVSELFQYRHVTPQPGAYYRSVPVQHFE